MELANQSINARKKNNSKGFSWSTTRTWCWRSAVVV